MHIPSIEQAGGFTITTSPQTTSQQHEPYLDLAIQVSPGNPPAAFLWRSAPEILNSTVYIRVGGRLVYPPSTLGVEECRKIQRAVFVAGGVGVNPIMSMLSAMHRHTQMHVRAGGEDSAVQTTIGRGGILAGMPPVVRVLYSSKRTHDGNGNPEAVLFEDRIREITRSYESARPEGGHKDVQRGIHDVVDMKFILFETTHESGRRSGENVETKKDEEKPSSSVKTVYRRIEERDLLDALGAGVGPRDDDVHRADGNADRTDPDFDTNTVAYVCGPPLMTDAFVAFFKRAGRMDERRVLCEKWW